MSIDPVNPKPDSPITAGRPRTVDLALYAILARCVFGVLSGIALYAARPRIISDFHSSQPAWTDAKLHHQASTYLLGNLLVAIAFTVMVLLVARYIRNGRNWARWFYAGISVFPTSDIFKLAVFGQNVPTLFKIATGLTGVAAVIAVSLLFVRPSKPYFQRATFGGAAGVKPTLSFRGLFTPKALTPEARQSRAPQRPTGKPRPARQAKPAASPATKLSLKKPDRTVPASAGGNSSAIRGDAANRGEAANGAAAHGEVGATANSGASGKAGATAKAGAAKSGPTMAPRSGGRPRAKSRKAGTE